MSRSSGQSMFSRAAAAVAVGVTATVASLAGVSVAAAATSTSIPADYAVAINQGNVPTTAAGFANHSCDEFAGKAGTADGWLFVASPDNFTSFEAVFDQGTVYYNDPHGATSSPSTSVSFPKPNDHLAVVTPAGWTLQNAYAVLDGDATFFTLSHTCAATDQTAPQPTVDFTDSCNLGAIVATLSNTAGTAAAHFTLTYGGGDHFVDVPAGASTTQDVPVAEDTTGSLTVTAAGLANAPITHTWARNCTANAATTAAAPTATLTHSCDLGGINVTLGNVAGTAPADFSVRFAGSDHAKQVAPGATLTFLVPVAEDTTDTVTVTATGMTAQTDTFARNCSTSVAPQQHAVNPAVSFATGCTTGITATLSNLSLDDTTTDAVTFAVTTPTGAVEQIVVGPNQITKRSYDFADGTTGTVSVEAPGLAKQSKSFAKSCTAVLGEKVTKGVTVGKVTKGTKTTKAPKPPAVQGTKVTRLPFTGAPTSDALGAALALMLAGGVLTLLGRPRRGRHARA